MSKKRLKAKASKDPSQHFSVVFDTLTEGQQTAARRLKATPAMDTIAALLRQHGILPAHCIAIHVDNRQATLETKISAGQSIWIAIQGPIDPPSPKAKAMVASGLQAHSGSLTELSS